MMSKSKSGHNCEQSEQSLSPAILAHELRSPIGAVQGFAELIASEAYGPVGDPRYIDLAKQIQNACCHVEQIAASVLTQMKRESVEGYLHEEVVDVSKLLRESQAWLQNKIIDGQVSLHLNTEAEAEAEAEAEVESVPNLGAICVRGDARSLRQSILNVLDNAIKYTPSGGCIDAKVLIRSDGGVDLTVCNDLCGEKTHLQSGRDVSVLTGQGLGLYITRAQMQAHGGSVQVVPDGGGRINVVLSLPAERSLLKPRG